jgi:deoxyribonuclease IV
MQLRIGAHVSASGGLESAVERAKRIGAECVQVFVGSPRVWAAPQPDLEVAQRFHDRAIQADVVPAFVHSAYLINLASEDESLRARSTDLLANSMAWGAAMGAAGVVTHIGSLGQSTEQEAEDRVVECLERVLGIGHRVHLLLETAAGTKRIGGSVEQLGRLVGRLSEHFSEHFSEHWGVGVCIDTAHMYASGYDVSSHEGLEHTLAEIDRYVGIARIELVHINDSKVALGHGADRHANSGTGHIGETGLANVLTHPALRHLPFVTEAPGFEDQGPDAENISILKRLAEGRLSHDRPEGADGQAIG